MKIPLEPDRIYHIYNHANGKENLFENEGNYGFFLKKYAKHISTIADTFAYCLMPNHFHVVIKIKPEEIIKQLQLSKNNKMMESSKYLSKQFSNLFSSYAQAFNKQQSRMGSLFIPNFSRKLVDTDDYFRQVIYYTHFNPIHHNFTKDLAVWKHSSYGSFLSEKPTNLKRNQVFELFGNKNDFLDYHQKDIDTEKFLDLEK